MVEEARASVNFSSVVLVFPITTIPRGDVQLAMAHRVFRHPASGN
jgi:hypothetical protein